ncbi:MAG: glycosyltransferase [Rhodobacteraceae bacterium]|nr:glycosyltransferase [Paracoccaceae bacterium]
MASPKIEFLARRIPKLGSILLARGNISKIDLNNALKMQSNRDALLGEIIVSHQMAKQADIENAVDIQFDGITLDISTAPADPDLLDGLDPIKCLEIEIIPWRRINNQVVIAAANPHDPQVLQFAENRWPGQAKIVRAKPAAIRAGIEVGFRQELTKNAHNLCPEKYSCREIGQKLNGVLGLLVVLSIAALVFLFPSKIFLGLLLWALLANFATTVLRATALGLFLFGRDRIIVKSNTTPLLSDFRKRPKITVLVPLFHENRVLDALLSALEKLTYPKELLDIKILLEEKDEITAAALATRILPRWIEVITVPADTLQTKPRAMNYALPFCKGEIIGIYDAEDRPDPDQIDKVVSHLMAAPNSVGSVQCYLDFYNTKRNWMSRCFTIEYAVWFRVIMRGLQRMGAPLPLGGTSVFVRRNVLQQVGAWDAHNVTEDADLGMRMARFGYRCEIVDSTTWEEANSRPVAWVKQRSRWLKGFAMTWATHMRNPLLLLKELGPIGFFGFQVIFLGTLTSFLSAPLFWVIWTGFLGVEWAFFDQFSDGFWVFAFGLLILGEAVMILIAMTAVLLKKRPALLPIIFTLFLYWPLGTFAAYKAIFELFFAPFYWDKTDHGLD